VCAFEIDAHVEYEAERRFGSVENRIALGWNGTVG